MSLGSHLKVAVLAELKWEPGAGDARIGATSTNSLDVLARTVRFSHQQSIYRQGDPISNVYEVIAGVVRIDKVFVDGRRSVVRFVLPGEFLGLSSDQKNAFNATALGKVEACRYDRSKFFNFVSQRPDMLIRLHDVTGRELCLAQAQMVLLGRMTARERVAGFLNVFRQRWEAIHGRSATIPLLMTRREIGDYLGLTIETVSREFGKLVHDKVILVVPDGVRILNDNVLASIVCQ